MPVCKNPECGRRFVSEGTPGCPYCHAQWLATLARGIEPATPPAQNESRTYLKAHLRKQRGVWQVWPAGHYSTRPTTSALQLRGQIDCVRWAATWNAYNA